MSFKTVTEEILKAGQGYRDIDPQMEQMFQDAMQAFVAVSKAVYTSEEPMEVSSTHIKVQVFETIFGIDINEELNAMVKNILESGETPNSDEDINNADEDLLKNIRANIESYIG